MQSTEAGRALLDEARAVLARYDQLLPAIARYTGEGGGVIRLGIPDELPSEVLRALATIAAGHPDLKVQPRHLAMAEQLAALRSGQLDASFMHQVPPGRDLDNMLVARGTWECCFQKSSQRDWPVPTAFGWTLSPGWTGWPSRARTARLGTTNWPPSCAPTASTSARPVAATSSRPSGHIRRAQRRKRLRASSADMGASHPQRRCVEPPC